MTPIRAQTATNSNFQDALAAWKMPIHKGRAKLPIYIYVWKRWDVRYVTYYIYHHPIKITLDGNPPTIYI